MHAHTNLQTWPAIGVFVTLGLVPWTVLLLAALWHARRGKVFIVVDAVVIILIGLPVCAASILIFGTALGSNAQEPLIPLSQAIPIFIAGGIQAWFGPSRRAGVPRLGCGTQVSAATAGWLASLPVWVPLVLVFWAMNVGDWVVPMSALPPAAGAAVAAFLLRRQEQQLCERNP